MEVDDAYLEHVIKQVKCSFQNRIFCYCTKLKSTYYKQISMDLRIILYLTSVTIKH